MSRIEMRSRFVSGYNLTTSTSAVRISLLQAKKYPVHIFDSHQMENLVGRLQLFLLYGLLNRWDTSVQASQMSVGA